MKDHDKPENEIWEEKINALLDGELAADEAEKLKAEAEADHELARAIIEAYQLQRAMEHVGLEKAPASLRRSLKKIPGQNRSVFLQPRWVMAFAVVPVAVISLVLLQPRPETMPTSEQVPFEQVQAGPETMDPAKIEKARQELEIAFAYIDLVSEKTSHRIEAELGGGMTDAVAGSIFKTIQQQKIL